MVMLLIGVSKIPITNTKPSIIAINSLAPIHTAFTFTLRFTIIRMIIGVFECNKAKRR